MPKDQSEFTLDDLKKAFIAGFRNSNDCGYDGAEYVGDAPNPSRHQISRVDLLQNFEEWRAGTNERLTDG